MKKKSKYKYILGIQCFASMDSGACILRANTKTKKYDYIAISEERLIIKKYPYTFPLHSIKYCIDHFNLKKLSDLPNIEELTSAGLIDNANVDTSIFGTGKFYKEQISEKKENIYSNIDDMINQSLKNEED